MIKIDNNCALKWLKQQPDFSADIIYCDPPYALGSEIIIKPDGKPDYKKAVDFMAKWEMPDGSFWDQFYKECMRVLKHGGHLLMFGIDRQLFLFGYYSNLAGFETKQSLYWYFISNFPKASDLSKMIDKNAGAEREVVGKKQAGMGTGKTFGMLQDGNNTNVNKDLDITTPSTPLAKKYDGYKYSIAPLKQVVETIMVFQKPYKTGSCLHDVLAYENGDETVTCGALDIEGNRVELTNTDIYDLEKRPISKVSNPNIENFAPSIEGKRGVTENGRFPAQTFVSPETAEILDKQSGVSKSTGGGNVNLTDSKVTYGKYNKTEIKKDFGLGDTGGSSKILHKCEYETADYDLFVYEPKVSASERNAGCEYLEEKPSASSEFRPNHTEKAENGENGNPYGRWKKLTNNHPTLKPVSLNAKISKLFKTPNPQTALIPFSGAGSEIIGLFKAGFENIKGCELNPEFVEISKARVKHHCTDLFNPNPLIE